MNHPNFCDDAHLLSPGDPSEFGEDKATQTRRKNAEAQKLYRERKKQFEAGLLSKVQFQQERINQLEAQLAFERAEKQNQASWPLNQGWLDPGHQLPPYSQNQTYIPPVTQTGRCNQHDPHNFAPLDAKFMQSASAVNALFQATYDNPYSPFYSRSSSYSPLFLLIFSSLITDAFSLYRLDSRSKSSLAPWARISQ